MLNKNTIKHIHSLRLKKYRNIHKQFIAEGETLVWELLHSRFGIREIYATKAWLDKHQLAVPDLRVHSLHEKDLRRISSLKTPNKVLAIIDIPDDPVPDPAEINDMILALDNVQDPGNLGTIIRIADWFGIHELVCSSYSVDCYNPKVVQATMGSIARVNIRYTGLPAYLDASHSHRIYGTYSEGTNMYETSFHERSIVVFGNESRGISPEVEPHVSRKIHIPPFPAGKREAESLNLSVAVGIVCSEIRRNQHSQFL